jgi:hypothetical protein
MLIYSYAAQTLTLQCFFVYCEFSAIEAAFGAYVVIHHGRVTIGIGTRCQRRQFGFVVRPAFVAALLGISRFGMCHFLTNYDLLRI